MTNLHYRLRFPLHGLEFGPNLSRAEHKFSFNDINVSVQLPLIPENVIHQNGTHHHIHASERDRTGTLVAANLWQVSIVIAVSEFIPKNGDSDPSEKDFHRHSRIFERTSKKAFDYWIRIMRWKLDYPEIENKEHFPRLSAGIPSDVIDLETGSAIWPKMRGYFGTAEKYFRLNLVNWSNVQAALSLAPIVPLWIDFYGFASVRYRQGDTRAAYIDLAIACESRLRSLIDEQLPISVVRPIRHTVRQMRMSDILRDWSDLSLPKLPSLTNIRELFKIRNLIMHRGETKQIDEISFKDIARDVRALF